MMNSQKVRSICPEADPLMIGNTCSLEEVEKVFAERKAGWKKKEIKHEGVLKFLNEI